MSSDAVSDFRDRRRARRSDTNSRGKGVREGGKKPREVDEREREHNGECARGCSLGIKAQQE